MAPIPERGDEDLSIGKGNENNFRMPSFMDDVSCAPSHYASSEDSYEEESRKKKKKGSDATIISAMPPKENGRAKELKCKFCYNFP